MPGPVSDSYDPEFGTGSNTARIDEELAILYKKLTTLLGGVKPIFIVELVDADLPRPIKATFTEKEWRILRFALERSRDSL